MILSYVVCKLLTLFLGFPRFGGRFGCIVGERKTKALQSLTTQCKLLNGRALTLMAPALVPLLNTLPPTTGVEGHDGLQQLRETLKILGKAQQLLKKGPL